MKIKSACAWLGCIFLSIAGPAAAQNFTDKVVTMVVNYSPGGPTDIEARIVAQYLPKYLKGVRSVVVRNAGGAGGIIGVNQLGASSDGEKLNLGFFTWDPMDQLIDNDALRVRYDHLNLIAGIKQVTLVYMRKDTPPGIKQAADIAKSPLVTAGALSPTNHLTVRQRLALDLLGVKYETIAGYRGLRDIDTAIQRKEIQLTSNSLPGWYASVKPTLADTGIVTPIFQYDYRKPDGTPGRSPDLPDVPSFTEVYKNIHGENTQPGGEKWQALQLLGRIMDSMYRTVFMPPNAPKEAVQEMRNAFEQLSRDADFIAAYERVVQTKPRMIIGAEGEAIIQQLGRVDPSVQAYLRKYVAR